MFGIFNKREKLIFAPVSGKCIDITEVNDGVFSSKMLGDGFAIIPNEDVICAPLSGEIVMIPDSKHAFGIRNKQGVEVLVHIGLDTVRMKGEGFQSFVAVGQQVKVGQAVVKIDLELIRKNNFDTVTIVILTSVMPDGVGKKCLGSEVSKHQSILILP